MGQTGTGTYDAQGNEVMAGFFDNTSGYAQNPNTYGDSFKDINPWSQQAGQNLFGNNANNFIQQGLGQAGQFDPSAGFNQFINNQAPQLVGLISGQMSPLQQSLTARAQQLSNQGVNTVADRFSGRNALNSSAFGANAMQAAAQPFADVANQLGQQQLGLTGQLFGQQLPLAQQQQQFQANLGQQGAMGLLGLQSNFGDQTFVQPDMVQNSSGFNDFMGGINDVVNTGTGIANTVLGFM